MLRESWVGLGGGSSALVLCGVGIFLVVFGGLQPLTVVAGVSILCRAEALGPPIFIMSLGPPIFIIIFIVLLLIT